MPNYQNGKIYKIINLENKVIYIGSTTERLCNRYAKHKHKANGNRIILLELCPCNSREELVKKEQAVIEQYDNLLNQMRAYNSEEYYKEYFKKYHKVYNEKNKDKISEKTKVYREENKEQISKIKKKWYEKNKDTISEKGKEHYEENKNEISEKHRVYYEENKDKIIEKRNVKLICECGCEINKQNMIRHKKTTKHIKLMESK